MRIGRIALLTLLSGLLLAVGAMTLKAVRPGERERFVLASGETAAFDSAVLILKDFRVPKYPSGRPRQYESEVIVGVPGEVRMQRAVVSVNHPLRWRGWWIYQDAYDDATERTTELVAFRDPWLPLAALAGALLLAGAMLGVVGFGAPPTVERRVGLVSRLAGAFVVVVPLVVIARVVLRPEPIPALQSPLLAPHVAAYAVSYVIMLFAAFGIARRLMPFGFFAMTLGLVLGAIWGKLCWGDFWQYDPKEMWSLATWLCYLAYFAFRSAGRRTEFLLRLLGAILIVLTATWVNFSRLFSGLHSYS